jgi:flagellar biosynthesis GTPase FlhF
MVALIVAGLWLRRVADQQLRDVYLPLRRAIDAGQATALARYKRTIKEQEDIQAHAAKRRDMEMHTAKERRTPLLARATRNLETGMQTAEAEKGRQATWIHTQCERAKNEAEKQRREQLAHLQQKMEQELAAIRQRQEKRLQTEQAQYQQQLAALQQRWTAGLDRLRAPMREGRPFLAWEDEAWAQWTPPRQFASQARFGEMRVDLKQITEKQPKHLKLPPSFSVAGVLTFPEQGSLLIHTDHAGHEQAVATLRNVMLRLLTSMPAGRVRFTLIDPIGLGKNFAGFMHLADYDEALVGSRIWSDAEQIDRQLANLTEHMETVIQKYLRNEFATIDDYNAQAGELAEPYRFLAIADLPVNFSPDALRRLSSILSSGPRCGVYTLIVRDVRQNLPPGTHLEELEAHGVNLVRQEDRFVWKDEVFRQFPLTLDAPPSEEFATRLLNVVGREAKLAQRVEVPFETIAPPAEKFWSMSTKEELQVPIGRLGATRLQMLKLGRGVAQHVLIAGKTGSGKSTLLHALVTNLAMWYSPAEVEF